MKMNEPDPALTACILALIDDSPASVYVCDAESFELLFVNERAAKMCGKTVEEACGRTCYEYLKGRNTPCVPCYMETSKDTYTERAYSSEKSGKHYLTRGKFIDFNGRRALIEYLTDETARTNALRAEEQRHKEVLELALDAANAASRAKSEFVSRMSHDMRTPLNAILGLSDAEMTAGATEAQKDAYLREIHASGDYLRGIINDVLDMSRIESRKLLLAPEPYALSDFRHAIQTVIGEQCRLKGIAFEFLAEGNTAEWVWLDRVRFNQIFVNLLSNAVRFTPSGGKVTFTVQRLSETSRAITERFTVRDNGIGMSAEFLPHAFESFSQEQRANTSINEQGTGLGLTIVKQLVELMGGTIAIESAPEQGTTVTVDLTVEIAPAPGASPAPACDFSSLSGTRILLCEDHPLNAEITANLLHKKGCSVECAENGEIGLSLFMDSDIGYYDTVLMDIRMPVMDGLAATRAIRALDRPDAMTVPIIALTADAFNADTQTSLSAGMNDHLSKPIQPRLLFETIQKHVSRR